MKFLPKNFWGKIGVLTLYAAGLAALIVFVGGASFRSVARGALPAIGPSSTQKTSSPATPKVAITASSAPTVAVDHIHFVCQGSSSASVTIEKDGDTPQKVACPSSTRYVLDNDIQVYTFAAALQGGGQVTVKIFINGHLMDTANATGGFNTAIATMIRNSNGIWVATQPVN